jgi:dUTP pyrophosphatase
MADNHSIDVLYQIVSDLFREEYEPKYATSGSAGMDLHACIAEPVVVSPGARVRIPTGLALQFPDADVVGLVYARSGLAWRHGLGLPNGVGVIDSDYTGELQVLLANFGSERYTVHPGDRIAQIVFAPVFAATLQRTASLVETKRGSAGFGSTGM